MKPRYFSAFSVLIALLSMMSGCLPAVTEVSPVAQTAPPTQRPPLKIVEFDLNSINKVPPGDVINQISFMSQGGGDELCNEKSYPIPTITRTSEPFEELMVYSYMGTCGWSMDETLNGSVQFPNGQTQSVNVTRETSNGFNTGELEFRPAINDPAGKYTLTMTGKSKTLQFVVEYTTSDKPHVYTVDNNHILLDGFLPFEEIKLFFYSGSGGDFKGWQEYTTNTDGSLEIETSMDLEKGDFFVAIGEKTGEVHMLFDDFYGGSADWVRESSIISKFSTLCLNGLPSHVQVGDLIRAAYTDGSNLKIRDQAGFSESSQHKVPEGTKMTVLGGPKCADGSTWWRIELSDGTKGWVAEYWHGNEYLIEPAP